MNVYEEEERNKAERKRRKGEMRKVRFLYSLNEKRKNKVKNKEKTRKKIRNLYFTL